MCEHGSVNQVQIKMCEHGSVNDESTHWDASTMMLEKGFIDIAAQPLTR